MLMLSNANAKLWNEGEERWFWVEDMKIGTTGTNTTNIGS